MHAAPGDARVRLPHHDLAHFGFDFRTGEADFVEAGAGFDRRGGSARLGWAAFAGGEVYSAQLQLDEGVAGEEVASAQQQGVHGVGGGLGGFPVLSLLLFEQPDAAILDGLGVVGDFVKGFDHEGLGFDGGVVPPPAQLEVAPEPAHLLVGHAAFFEGGHDGHGGWIGRAAGFGEAVEGEGEVALGLAAVGLEPVFARLGQEEFEGGLVLRVDRLVVEEEAAAIQIQSVGGAGNVFVGLRPALDALIMLVHPAVQPVQRAQGRLDADVRLEVAQAAEAGGDVEGDVVVAGAAGEPRPRAVRELHSVVFGALRDISESSRLASKRMPTLRRAWLSFCASRSQGVSSSMTLLRSWFFSSGLSSAGVLRHCSNTRAILGSLLARVRASELA